MACRVINQTAGEIRIQANRLLAMLTNIVEHAEATAAAADLTDDDAQRADIWMDLKKIRGALTRAELAIKRSAKASGLNIEMRRGPCPRCGESNQKDLVPLADGKIHCRNCGTRYDVLPIGHE